MAAVSGCSSPTPPKVTVHSSEFVSSSAKELVVRVHLSMNNVNSYAMTLQSVKAKVTVAGHAVTEVLVPYTISLPPNKDVPVDTDLGPAYKMQNEFLADLYAAVKPDKRHSLAGISRQ